VADRVERLTELVMVLLDSSTPRSFEELADAGLYPDTDESSRRAFERDKASLKEIGVPLQTRWDDSAHGTARYVLDPSDWFLDLDLTPAERVALQLAAAAIRLDEDWDERALARLGGDPGQPVPVIADLPALDALPTLYEAMRRRAEARFVYNGRRRAVLGHGVFYRDGHWYLTADDAGAVKVFRVDRIDGDVVLGPPGSYQLPDGVDPTAALSDDPLLIGEGDEVIAHVTIDRLVAPRVRRLPGVAVVAEHTDGSIDAELRVRHREAFRSWVLGLRHHAEVTGPPDLRARTVEWLESIAEAG
jgi:proteasome accessory factor B